jgi:hypothetical protein
MVSEIDRWPSTGDDTDLLGVIKSVHDDVTVLALGNVDVNGNARQTFRRHGTRPDDPDYTVIATSTHHDVSIYHLSMEDITATEPSAVSTFWDRHNLLRTDSA